MSDKQRSFRVTDEVKAAFGAYANTLGMHDSELVRVLILRERQHCRLRKFVDAGGRISAGASGHIKITAHFPSRDAALAFDEYASRCGVGTGRAGAWIIEQELREHWFEAVLAAA